MKGWMQLQRDRCGSFLSQEKFKYRPVESQVINKWTMKIIFKILELRDYVKLCELCIAINHNLTGRGHDALQSYMVLRKSVP